MQQLREWAVPADAAVRSLGNLGGSSALRAPNAALRVLEYVEQLETELTIERLRSKRLVAKLERYEKTG